MRFFKIFAALFALFFVACQSESKDSSKVQEKEDIVIKVGATPVPHAEILNFIKPDLKKDGVDLQVVDFTDYVTPNLSLEDGSIDANFMQHKPYLDKINKDRDLHLVSIANIHVEPIAFYSKNAKSIDLLKDGGTIAVPNDPSNMGRSLILLHNNGLIKLKDPTNLYASEVDIVENPHNFVIKPMDAASIPRVFGDVEGAVINGNYALQAKLSAKDALFIEGKESPYANILVVKEGMENNEGILKLKKALQSEDVKKFIIEKYKGEVVPAF